MKYLLLIILSFSAICCNTKLSSSENKNQLISSIISALNNWDKDELKCFEQPNDCLKEFGTSTETKEWVSINKSKLIQLDRIAVWNYETKEYEPFLLSDYHKVAIKHLKNVLSEKENLFIEERYYTFLYGGKQFYHCSIAPQTTTDFNLLANNIILDISDQSVSKGHLNNDSKIDFIINYSWHHAGGNLFGDKWGVFVSSKNGWISIPNNFENMSYGKKTEIITSVANGTINTELILNKNKDSSVNKKYLIKDNRLEEVK